MDETRATAKLPNLDIEIVHRRAPDDSSEQVSITVRAVPGFEAFGRFIGNAWLGSPTAYGNWLAFTPFGLWARMLQDMGAAFQPYGATGGLIDRGAPRRKASGRAPEGAERQTGSDRRIVHLPPPTERR